MSKKEIFNKLENVAKEILQKINLAEKCEISKSKMYNGICIWMCHYDFLKTIENAVIEGLENFELPVRIRANEISNCEAQILLMPIF